MLEKNGAGNPFSWRFRQFGGIHDLQQLFDVANGRSRTADE